MHILKGALVTLFAAVILGGVYVSSVILGWVLALLSVVALIIGGLAVVVYDLFTTFRESCKKPSRKR